MPYKNLERRKLSTRGSVRTHRHGNWRQTYINCLGMCVAAVNGDAMPCGAVDELELHETFGETGQRNDPKLQQRVLLCNLHHALLEDRGHQAALILDQYKPSRLAEDVALEIMVEGGYQKWVTKWGLDDSRSGCLLFSGPYVEDYGDG